MKTQLFEVIIVIHFMWFSFGVKAQPEPDSVKLWTIYPGYIITHENDTVHGYIRLNNLVDNQEKALFYEHANDVKSKIKYRAKDIKGYQVGPRFYESLDYSGPKASRNINFLLRLIEGPICYYEWYYEPEEVTKSRLIVDEEDILNSKIDLSFNEENLNDTWIAVKLGGEPLDLCGAMFIIKFKNKMADFVSDYPELADKIRNKQDGYLYTDIPKMIREYNTWYLAKQEH